MLVLAASGCGDQRLAGAGAVSGTAPPASTVSPPSSWPNLNQAHRSPGPHQTYTLPPLHPYTPVSPTAQPPRPVPTTLDPHALDGFAPGVRRLFLDGAAKRLSNLAFVKVALGKLGEGPFAVPSRYEDTPSAMSEGDLMALALAVRGEEQHLTQEQLAELREATKGWPGSR